MQIVQHLFLIDICTLIIFRNFPRIKFNANISWYAVNTLQTTLTPHHLSKIQSYLMYNNIIPHILYADAQKGIAVPTKEREAERKIISSFIGIFNKQKVACLNKTPYI